LTMTFTVNLGACPPCTQPLAGDRLAAVLLHRPNKVLLARLSIDLVTLVRASDSGRLACGTRVSA
jgi:hypothetical protein